MVELRLLQQVGLRLHQLAEQVGLYLHQLVELRLHQLAELRLAHLKVVDSKAR